ncbi:phage holin family protein [Sinosporangium siamense]|uniref:Holin-X, holin superfamily III n=1 Tax=Sinosporangium siamense TaxID=1367973 RepID=A0A919REL3_9ACTN|nr:phage holin family protein [Sinosporangium siamense]GII92272.1 hypothetical protein Ssi02_25030 [Sinosporangium siamense]
MAAKHSDPASAREDATARLAADATELVRQEIARVRADLTGDLQRVGVGAGLLAAGGLLGLLGLHAGSIAMLHALESVMPQRRAELLLVTGYLTASTTLTLLALRQLRGAGLFAKRAVSQMKQQATDAAEAVQRVKAETR